MHSCIKRLLYVTDEKNPKTIKINIIKTIFIDNYNILNVSIYTKSS